MKASDIKALLPAVFQQTLHPESPLQTLLEVMEGQHAPSEGELDRLNENFDPERARVAMLGFLATWLDLDRFRPEVGTQAPRYPTESEVSGLRALIGQASTLSRWRGTAAGLIHCLELATGCHGFRIEQTRSETDGRPLPFQIRLVAPTEARSFAPLITRIISQEKPAHVACRLEWSENEPPRSHDEAD